MTIRTLVEVRGGRVSIVEDGDETQVTITRDDRDEVTPGQPFYQAAVDAERELVAAVRRVEELVAERDALLLKVEGYDNDRKTERDRADKASETIEIAKNHMRDLDHAKTKLSRIQDKVWKGTLDFAMNHRGAPEEIPVETVGDLANTVSAVRSIVGQP
jgi:hypothetical protein